MEAYNKNTIEQAIQSKWAGKTVHFAEITGSTNAVLKELAAQGAEEGTLAVADYQSAGRGRFERVWAAPPGTAVTMSLLLRPSFPALYASTLTLVMGLSVAQACEKLGFSSGIKWPNDVVIGGKKICGILTEMRPRNQEIEYVVIGVGINVNIEEFPEDVRDKATSLRLEAGQCVDRNQVIAQVMECFEKNYEIYCRTCDLSELKEAYERILANRNQPVRVLEKDGGYEGICLGINRKGELLVQLADGTVNEVFAGEVSVRGMYSYV